ncbi:MAG: NifU family protein [Flavobacteriales bacterium]|nr:MAG: NifU family protein [Flavobacteriales bacterium]
MSKTNITVQLTKNENIVKFVTNSFITQSKSYEFNNIDEAEDSPITQHLFHLPFVKTVYISQNFIAIEKFPFNLTQVKWEDVQTEVANTISDYLKSGQQVIIKKEDDFSKKNPITIYAESTPNPEVLKFVANRSLANTMYEFKNKSETVFAPLAGELFNFPFVKEVFMNTNYISITKKDSYNWQEFSNELREYIRNYIEEGKTIFKDEILQKEEQTNQLTEDRDYTEIEKEIISILNEYIRPAVEGDGGNIAFDSYNTDTKTVKVILQGACSGCPSSTITLKNGIENMLREMLHGKVEFVEALNQ